MYINIDKKEFKKWLKALYSGEYKQGRHKLQTRRGYCCLGVACKILIENPIIDGTELDGGFPADQPNAPQWLKEINSDFIVKAGLSLIYLNDKQRNRFTFPEIADLLYMVYHLKVLS